MDDPIYTENELLKKGVAVEVEGDDFFAVDVPPSVDQKAIDKYLVKANETGRWATIPLPVTGRRQTCEAHRDRPNAASVYDVT